jgi:hypothetical protein
MHLSTYFFREFWGIAHNVPVVANLRFDDGLAARIEKCVAKPRLQKCGGARMPLTRQLESGNVQTEGLSVAE